MTGGGGRLLNLVPDFGQAILRQRVVRGELQRLLEVLARHAIQFFCGINTPKIVVGIMVGLVTPGLQRALKPRYGLVVLAFFDQVAPISL